MKKATHPGKWNLDSTFADKIATTAITRYNNLSNKGKPQKHEWTLLAAILMSIQYGNLDYQFSSSITDDCYTLEVVSLGTGTKCIGKDKMSTKGNILNDSHAEVIARRAFIVFVLG